MKQVILNYIRQNKEVTMAAMCRDIPQVNGNCIWSTDLNVIIWDKCSQEAIDALQRLILEGYIFIKPISILQAIVDGNIINYPIANKAINRYRSPHWLPIAFVISFEYLATEMQNLYRETGVIKNINGM